MSSPFGTTIDEARASGAPAGAFEALEARTGVRTGVFYAFGTPFRVAIRTEGAGAPEARAQYVRVRNGETGYGLSVPARPSLMALMTREKPREMRAAPTIGEITRNGPWRLETREGDALVFSGRDAALRAVGLLTEHGGRIMSLPIVPVRLVGGEDPARASALVDTSAPLTILSCAAMAHMVQDVVDATLRALNETEEAARRAAARSDR